MALYTLKDNAKKTDNLTEEAIGNWSTDGLLEIGCNNVESLGST